MERPRNWLALLFSLPAQKAAVRVDVWRRIKKSGALGLEGGGYLLPDSEDRREQFEWIAATVRRSGGSASVLKVSSVNDLSHDQTCGLFNKARDTDYRQLAKQFKALGKAGEELALNRLRKRFLEVVAVDFFGSPLRATVENLLAERNVEVKPTSERVGPRTFVARTWLTRPRPKIDRVASAWLIKTFIDKRAVFAFGDDPTARPNAIPFDMYHKVGFGHRGDDCTFETLLKEFGLRDKALIVMGEMIHDTDLGDEKFGRVEGIGILAILTGWLNQGVSDQEMLKRGSDLMHALWQSLSTKKNK